MKQLITALDKGIKRRLRLKKSEDPVERERLRRFKIFYNKCKVIKWIALLLYMILPIFEKPSWCINNTEILKDTNEGYWFC